MLQTTANHVLVRWATEQDDLACFLEQLTKLGHQLNREAILVAESARGIEGMAAMFDGGHSLMYADHLLTRDGAPFETGPQLILALNAYCQAHGKTGLLLVTGDLKLAYLAERRGAVV